MSSQRVNVVLEMVFDLQEKGYFCKSEIQERFNISRSTFFRSLSDLRCFLLEQRPYIDLEFDPEKDTYVLQKVDAK